jgi:hypothetical protein
MKRYLMWGIAAASCAPFVLAQAAFAQGGEPPAPRTMPPASSLGYAVLTTLIFGLLGIGLAIAGFKLFDAATPFHLEKEICEKGNLAAAILAGFVILGICIIIAATVLS